MTSGKLGDRSKNCRDVVFVWSPRRRTRSVSACGCGGHLSLRENQSRCTSGEAFIATAFHEGVVVPHKHVHAIRPSAPFADPAPAHLITARCAPLAKSAIARCSTDVRFAPGADIESSIPGVLPGLPLSR